MMEHAKDQCSHPFFMEIFILGAWHIWKLKTEKQSHFSERLAFISKMEDNLYPRSIPPGPWHETRLAIIF
jgi:hypothetical protein